MHLRTPRPAHVFPQLALAAAVTAGCADPVGPTTRAAGAARTAAAAVAADDVTTGVTPARSAASTRRRLVRAAAGLVYTSESDYPFEYVAFAANARAPLDDAAFRRAVRVPADSAVEVRTLDDFFARHIERVDPNDAAAVALVPRYRALKRALRTEVRGARVFRVGQIVIRCYVVGVDARGHVVGLATTAVET